MSMILEKLDELEKALNEFREMTKDMKENKDENTRTAEQTK